jgi:hypothetical protein
MSATLLALQHIAWEPPAAFEEDLLERGLDLLRVELDEGEAIPERDDFAGIVVMGGPMGAYDEDEHPWLAGEKESSATPSSVTSRSGACALALSCSPPAWALACTAARSPRWGCCRSS